MKTNKALLIALPLALAACGGGGGDNPAVDNTKPLTPNSGTQNNSQNSSTSMPDKYGLTADDRDKAAQFSKSIRGASTYNGIVIAGRASDIADKKSITTNKMPLEYKRQLETNSSLGTIFIPNPSDSVSIGDKAPIRVGGVDIYRGNRIYSSTSSFRTFDSFMASSDNTYKNIQFGIGENGTSNPFLLAYYRGRTTPDNAMPTSGVVNYSGDFVVPYDSVPSGVSPVGAVGATVDFTNKDASFIFGVSDYKGEIKAGIIGSYFVGKDGKKGVEGFFAGSNADEMVGNYTDNEAKVLGVFGAKRQ